MGAQELEKLMLENRDDLSTETAPMMQDEARNSEWGGERETRNGIGDQETMTMPFFTFRAWLVSRRIRDEKGSLIERGRFFLQA